jgi:hypothetical protein
LAVCQRLTAKIGRSSRLEDICKAALIALRDGLQIQQSAIQLFDADGVPRVKVSRGLSGVIPDLASATAFVPLITVDGGVAVDRNSGHPPDRAAMLERLFGNTDDSTRFTAARSAATRGSGASAVLSPQRARRLLFSLAICRSQQRE